MAARRIRATINNGYVQPLKLGLGRKVVITPNNDYNSILLSKKHRGASPLNYKAKLWAKFDGQNFDGIKLISGIYKDEVNVIPSGSCTFNISSVSLDGTWTETFLYSTPGTVQGDGTFIASATQANLGSSTQLDGELTFAIEVSLVKQGTTLTNKVYLNHLGIYDSFFRLKQFVDFLNLTKLDE